MGRLEETENKLLTEYRIYKKFILIGDIKYLLSEVKRLREAIEKHRDSPAIYFYRDCTATLQEGIEYNRDEELYKALEEEDK